MLDFKPWSDNLLQLRDDHWKHVRAQLSPTFSSGKLKKVDCFYGLFFFNSINVEVCLHKDTKARIETDLSPGDMTGSSAHVDKRNKQSHMIRTHGSTCIVLKRFTVVFENNTATCFAYIRMVL